MSEYIDINLELPGPDQKITAKCGKWVNGSVEGIVEVAGVWLVYGTHQFFCDGAGYMDNNLCYLEPIEWKPLEEQ